MNQLSLDEFIAQFPSTMHGKLIETAQRPDVAALARVEADDGRFTAQAFNQVPKIWSQEVQSIYCLEVLTSEENELKSKTMQALDLVINEGLSQYAAAAKVGISTAAVSRALSRREDKTLCPCCAQVVREGYAVDKTVLKTVKGA
tara:strand:+ start:252 stop:686 length:435 start_codon:yes stop_codon:yes gene_type:complete